MITFQHRLLVAAALPAALVAGLLAATGCGSETKPANSTSTTAQTAKADAGLVWPELSALDEFAHELEQLVEENRVADLRKLAPELKSAAEKLAASPIPADAKMKPVLEGMAKEIGTLAGSLASVESLSDDALKTTMEAFHPLVLGMMETAGMPHVHADEEPEGEEQGETPAAAKKDGGGSSGSLVAASSPVHIPVGEEKARLHAAGDVEHEHVPGPHGGYVFHLSPATHGEVVIDPATGGVRVYALDIDEKVTVLDDPMSAYLEFVGATNAGNAFKVSLAPDQMANSYAYFQAQDNALKGATSVTGRLTGKFRDAGSMEPVDRDVQWPPPPVAPVP